jgi:hypothetical protein
MCNEQKPPNDKLPGHLLSLWIHQNTILWGRLQTIGVIQVAVVAGWYSLFDGKRYAYAALATLLGAALSFAVYVLVDCDLEWRRDIKKRLVALEPDIFPKDVGGISGWVVIKAIAKGFWYLDILLFAITVLTFMTYSGWLRCCACQ